MDLAYLAHERGYSLDQPGEQACRAGEARARLAHLGIEISAPVNLDLQTMNSRAKPDVAIEHIGPCIRPVVRRQPAHLGKIGKDGRHQHAFARGPEPITDHKFGGWLARVARAERGHRMQINEQRGPPSCPHSLKRCR